MANNPAATLSDTDTEDEEEETIPRWKKHWMQEDRKFVPTTASRLAEKVLDTHNRVVIVGGPGCGKSAIARHVALKYSRRKMKIIVVRELSDIKRAPLKFHPVVFVIDDPIGKSVEEEITCRSWQYQRKYLDEIFEGHIGKSKAQANGKLSKVIATYRSSLLDMDSSYPFKHYERIDLDSKQLQLSNEEKTKIIKKHTDCLAIKGGEKEEIIKLEMTLPLLTITRLVSLCKEVDILSFFKHPIEGVKKELQSLKKTSKLKYFCLFLLVLHGNRLSATSFAESDDMIDEPIGTDDEKDADSDDDSDDEDDVGGKYDRPIDDRLLSDLFETFGLSPKTSKLALLDGIKSLRGHYFLKVMERNFNRTNRREKILKTTDDAFLHILTSIFCKEFPDKFIKYCKSDFFVTMATSGTTADKINGWSCVPWQESYIEPFVDRIESDVKDGMFLNIFMSPWIRDERIQTKLISRLASKSHEEILDFALKSLLCQDVVELKILGKLKYFSRLDLIHICKNVSVLVLSLVLNMDKLFISMLDLLQKIPSARDCLNDAPLVSACCINGRQDLLKRILNSKDLVNDCWSQQDMIYALHIAANFLQSDIMNDILETGCDVGILTSYQQSALFLTASSGKHAFQKVRINGIDVSKRSSADMEVARSKLILMLLKKGANPDSHPEIFPCSLAFLCSRGNTDAIEQMLATGTKVNEASKDNRNSLHMASKSGNIKIVKMLLHKHVDVNSKTSKDFTALYCATLEGNDEIAELLLGVGNRSELQSKSENNPLFVASKNGRINLVQKFLQYAPTINCSDEYGNSALMTAIDNGHSEIVEILLKNGADLKLTRSDNGYQPIHVAAGTGSMTIVKTLLEHGADVECLSSDNSSPLTLAAENGHCSLVQVLLERNASANHVNQNGKTPLIFAAENGHLDTVRLLLTNKADVNLITKDHHSALTRASSHGHEQVVLELIRQSANVNQQTKRGATSLFLASENGHTEIVKILLNNNADFNLRTKGGKTPLYIAASFGHCEVVKEILKHEKEVKNLNSDPLLSVTTRMGHEQIVKLLIEKGAKVNVPDDDGLTPLLIAVKKGWTGIVKILLENGAETDVIRNNEDDDDDDDEEIVDDEKNALHYACEKGHAGVVKVLLDHGMDINAHKEESPTPLYLALDTGRVEVAQFLIGRGADINITIDNETTLYTACRSGLAEIVDLVLDMGGKVNPKKGPSPLAAAVSHNHYKIADRLVALGADVNVKLDDVYCPSLLMRVVTKDFTKIIKLLIKHGARTDVMNSAGFTLLHVNAYHGNRTAPLLMLLKCKMDVNARTNTGQTPLMLAVQEKTATKQRMELLVNHGANVNARDNDGDTALHIATEYGFVRILKDLLKHGADPSIRNVKGKTPLDIAIAKRNKKIEQVISEWKPKHSIHSRKTGNVNAETGVQRDIVVVGRSHPLHPVLPRHSAQNMIKKTWR